MYGYGDTNLIRRIMRKSGSWPGMWRIYARALHPLDGLVYRATKGRATFTSWVTGLPIVQLTTTGAKSGVRRTLPLVAIPNGDGLVIIASNYGQERHPAWFHNLRAHPDTTIQVGPRKLAVHAHVASDEEREHLWPKAVATYAGFDDYQERAGRTIPLVVLSPRL